MRGTHSTFRLVRKHLIHGFPESVPSLCLCASVVILFLGGSLSPV